MSQQSLADLIQILWAANQWGGRKQQSLRLDQNLC
jgi:hypothetical protein